MRRDELLVFAQEHDIPIGTVHALAEWIGTALGSWQ